MVAKWLAFLDTNEDKDGQCLGPFGSGLGLDNMYGLNASSAHLLIRLKVLTNSAVCYAEATGWIWVGFVGHGTILSWDGFRMGWQVKQKI